MKMSKMLAMAKMKKKGAKKPMSVEGSAAKPRLDRPMRRADGGPTLSKERKEYADEQQKDMSRESDRVVDNAVITGLGSALAATAGIRKPIRSIIGAGAAGAGATDAAGALARGLQATKRRAWALSGKAEEGKEDRKRGGSVHSDAAQDKKMIAGMIHKHEKHDHKGEKETKFSRGGKPKC